MKEASETQRVNAEANGLYEQWLSGLRLMKEITEPISKRIFLEDLMDLYDKAKTLNASNELQGVARARISLIVNSPLNQHITLARADGKTVVS